MLQKHFSITSIHIIISNKVLASIYSILIAESKKINFWVTPFTNWLVNGSPFVIGV